MKTKILFLLLIGFLFSCNDDSVVVEGNTVENIENEGSYALSPEEAGEILSSFIGKEIKTKSGGNVEFSVKKRHDYSVKTVSTKSGSPTNENVPVYEFEVKDGNQEGFALVIGDRRINTVLAYVPNGSLDDMENYPPIKDYMDAIPKFLSDDLAYMKKKAQMKSSGGGGNGGGSGTPPENTNINGFTEYYECYLSTAWDQGGPYNLLAPYMNNGVHRKYLGCAPVALGQIMAHHRKPNGYDWDLILSSPTVSEYDSNERKNEVARFLKYVADSIKTDFSDLSQQATPSSHGKIVSGGLQGLGYQFDYTNNFGNTWEFAIQNAHSISNSIKKGMPCYIASKTHAVVFDAYGYKDYSIDEYINGVPASYGRYQYTLPTSHYFHVNWGWGGLGNGLFLAFKENLFNKGSFYNDGVLYDGFVNNPSFAPYNYIINIKPEHINKTMLLMHFDDSVEDATGNFEIDGTGVTFVAEKFNKAAYMPRYSLYPKILNEKDKLKELFTGGNFTIDFWFFRHNDHVMNYFFYFGNFYLCIDYITHPSKTNRFVLVAPPDNQYRQFYVSPITWNDWNHIALTSEDGLIRFFSNGLKILESEFNIGDIDIYDNFLIGVPFYPTVSFTMTMDEFRITNYCAWTDDFTPPASPYQQ